MWVDYGRRGCMYVRLHRDVCMHDGVESTRLPRGCLRSWVWGVGGMLVVVVVDDHDDW